MSNQIDLTRGWFRKAECDLHTHRLLIKSDGPYERLVCMLSKLLKNISKDCLPFMSFKYRELTTSKN